MDAKEPQDQAKANNAPLKVDSKTESTETHTQTWTKSLPKRVNTSRSLTESSVSRSRGVTLSPHKLHQTTSAPALLELGTQRGSLCDSPTRTKSPNQINSPPCKRSKAMTFLQSTFGFNKDAIQKDDKEGKEKKGAILTNRKTLAEPKMSTKTNRESPTKEMISPKLKPKALRFEETGDNKKPNALQRRRSNFTRSMANISYLIPKEKVAHIRRTKSAPCLNTWNTIPHRYGDKDSYLTTTAKYLKEASLSELHDLFGKKFREEFKLRPTLSSSSLDVESIDGVVLSESQGRRIVSAATLAKSMELIASENLPVDSSFNEEFIYIYRYFISSVELFNNLVQKFWSVETTPAEQVEKETCKNKLPIQLRIINFLRKWITSVYQDFADNHDLHNELNELIKKLSSYEADKPHYKWWKILQDSVKKQRKYLKRNISQKSLFDKERIMAIAQQMNSPSSKLVHRDFLKFMSARPCFIGSEAVVWMKSKLCLRTQECVNLGNLLLKLDLIQPMQKNVKTFSGDPKSYYSFAVKSDSDEMDLPTFSVARSFMDFHPHDIAEHLTMIEFNIFSQIRLSELSFQAWTKNDKSEKASNVLKLIKRSNVVSNWVATEIVTVVNHNERLAVIKRFIDIAHQCKKYNNFNTVFEIMAGFSLTPVQRLKSTWKMLPPEYSILLDQLSEITDTTSNFKNLSKALKESPLPTLPYLGIYLTWLTFSEDGNKTFLDNGMINFRKCKLLASCFSDICKFQNNPYEFEIDPKLLEFLDKDLTQLPESDLYKQSRKIELNSHADQKYI